MNYRYCWQRFRRACFVMAAVAFSGLSGPPASAAEQSALSEGDFFGELPVVLSVSRLSQPTRDAPAAVTVIDAELIRSSGARDLADLLRLIPGFQVAYGDLGAPMAVYHGYLPEDEPRRLQVLIDGRSQYSPAFIGAVNWNTVDVQLQDIERIEVIRGTNAASYGSSAFLGVVNVITKNPATMSGVELYAASGNQGVGDRSVRARLPMALGFLRVSAESREDTGLPAVSYDNRKTRRAHMRFDQHVGDRDVIELSAGGTQADLGVAGDRDTQVPPDRSRAYQTEHIQAVWRHHFDSGAESQLRALRSVDRLGDALPLTASGLATFFNHNLRTVRNELEGQLSLSNGDWRGVIGSSYRDDSTRSTQFFGDRGEVQQTIWRGFGSAEWFPLRWAGVQAAANWENDSISGSNFSPRLMINLKPMPGHTLRFGASRGHRVPTIYEEYGREDYLNTTSLTTAAAGLSPPFTNVSLQGALLDSQTRSSGDLRPEQVDSLEIGYLLENPADHITLDARVFDERVEDAIVFYQIPFDAPAPPNLNTQNCELLALADSGTCGSARDFRNAGRSRIRGVEYQLRWQPVQSTRITFNQALIDVKSAVTSTDIPPVSASSSPESVLKYLQQSAPRRSQSLIVQKELLPRLDLFLAWHYVGSHLTTPGGNGVDEYRRLDWRIAYRFRLNNSDGELAYTVQSDGRPHLERKRGTNEFLSPRGWLSLRIAF